MDRLKLCREKHGLSQKQVAAELKVAAPTVSQWESGIKLPSRENVAKLADLYGVTIDYLMGRIEPAFEDMSPSVRQLMDYVKTVPEDKAAYVLRVMQTILSDESRK